MHTVLRSPTKEVVIGPDQPFCIIGERINPTGRKAFAEQLRAGDLSQVVVDVEEQVAGGAHVLDVNMGVPLTDEAALLARAVTLVQEHTDLPICIDSSVVEALAGRARGLRGQGARQLGHLRGRAARARAAARQGARRGDHLPRQRRDRHPADGAGAARGLQAARRHRPRPLGDPARGHRHRPARDDGRRRSARRSSTTLETIRLVREEFGLNMTLGASNVSFGLPDRHALGAAFLALASYVRADERDHGRAQPADRGRLPRRRPAARARRVGHELDRAHRQAKAEAAPA